MAVYQFRASGVPRHKIGFTDHDAIKRQKKLQTGCPFPLELVRVWDGGRDLEALAHDWFSAHRIGGEWFEFAEDMQPVIDAVMSLLQNKIETDEKFGGDFREHCRQLYSDLRIASLQSSGCWGAGAPTQHSLPFGAH